MRKGSGMGKWGIVGICSFVYFISYFSRKDFAAVMAGMIFEGVIDKNVGGLIGMGLFICYGVGQLISGYLGDKLKPKTLILSGLGATTVCNLLMPIIGGGYLLIPIWAVNGLAQAMLWPPIVRILSDSLDHESFVKANLAVTSAAHVATVLLYLYVPLCLEYMAWETVFYTATVLALCAIISFVLALIFILPKDAKIDTGATQTTEIGDGARKDASVLPVLFKAGAPFIFATIIMMGYLRDGIESWLPTLYCEAFGKSASESTLISVLLPVFAIASIIIITALHKTRLFNNEMRGSGILFLGCMVISLPMSFLMEVKSTTVQVLCLVMAATVCAAMHSCNFLLISCLPGRFKRFGKAATASGFCNACTYVGAAVSMYGMGLLSDLLGWSGVVMSWAIVAFLGAAFCFVNLVKYSAFLKEVEN